MDDAPAQLNLNADDADDDDFQHKPGCTTNEDG